VASLSWEGLTQVMQGGTIMPRPVRLPPIPFGYYYISLRAESGRNLITNAADLRMFLELTQLEQNRPA
jgi:hypothetical protein